MADAPPPAERSWNATRTVDAPPLETSIPAIPQTSGVMDVPGSSVSIAVTVATGGGPGQLRGSGSGDRQGVGDGRDGYSGSGGRGAGGHVEAPELLHQIRPSYTPAAMQARVRGIVVLEAVVERDGSVGAVKVVRSLDPTFGLDQEAIRTVRQWRFRAGRRDGVAVPVVVTIELAFELR
ncbi:MAG TPA: energy transducer TonB [Vicinamibacterales bacterium]|nr:energy transducer TonB [Vicinamibacterales bacterium]